MIITFNDSGLTPEQVRHKISRLIELGWLIEADLMTNGGLPARTKKKLLLTIAAGKSRDNEAVPMVEFSIIEQVPTVSPGANDTTASVEVAGLPHRFYFDQRSGYFFDDKEHRGIHPDAVVQAITSSLRRTLKARKGFVERH